MYFRKYRKKNVYKIKPLKFSLEDILHYYHTTTAEPYAVCKCLNHVNTKNDFHQIAFTFICFIIILSFNFTCDLYSLRFNFKILPEASLSYELIVWGIHSIFYIHQLLFIYHIIIYNIDLVYIGG